MRLLALPLMLAVCIPLIAAEDGSGSWLHWRGPTMQGVVADVRVPLDWADAKNVRWKLDLPADGHSSPIVVGGRIFLTGASEKGRERYVFCVDANTGKLLWNQTAAKGQPEERTHAWHGYASPSVATDGKRVFAFFGSPGVFCYDLDGNLKWSKAFGRFTSEAGWNTAASPFLFDSTVIVNCDNDGGAGSAPAALVALDKETGKEVWSTPRDQGRGFGTPMLLKGPGGREDLVLNGPDGVWGYDPKSGKERWRCTRSKADDQNRFGEPMPVSDGQHLFVLSGRTGLYQVIRTPDKGDVTATHVVLAEKRGKRDVASPILVRGKLLWVLGDGTAVVVEPGPTPKIVGRNKLPGGPLDWGASPAVVDGRMYLRSRTALYCIGE